MLCSSGGARGRRTNRSFRFVEEQRTELQGAQHQEGVVNILRTARTAICMPAFLCSVCFLCVAQRGTARIRLCGAVRRCAESLLVLTSVCVFVCAKRPWTLPELCSFSHQQEPETRKENRTPQPKHPQSATSNPQFFLYLAILTTG